MLCHQQENNVENARLSKSETFQKSNGTFSVSFLDVRGFGAGFIAKQYYSIIIMITTIIVWFSFSTSFKSFIILWRKTVVRDDRSLVLRHASGMPTKWLLSKITNIAILRFNEILPRIPGRFIYYSVVNGVMRLPV